MAKIAFLRPSPRKQEKKSSTENKAKLELLTEVRLTTRGEIEDIMGVKRGKGDVEEFEASDSMHEKDLFRRGLGFQQIANRGYAISPKNVQAYYELKLAFRERLEQDPDMERPLTREIYSLFLNAKNNLLQRTITEKQTNVEVVDTDPVIKYIPVPTWGSTSITDMEKKKDEE